MSLTFGEEFFNAWAELDFGPAELAEFLDGGQRLFLIGNGGSAGIASHMAADFLKNGDIPATALTDPATLTCLANDFSYADVFAKQIELQAHPHDILIAISSSGRSANILRACDAARSCDAKIVTLTGFDKDNPLSKLGDHNYHVASHDYGIVETVHLGMLHATLRELMNARR